MPSTRFHLKLGQKLVLHFCSLLVAGLVFVSLSTALAQPPVSPTASQATNSSSAATFRTRAEAEHFHNLSLVVEKVRGHVASKDLAPIISYDSVAMPAIASLLQQSAFAAPLKLALRDFLTKLNAVRNAARDRNHQLAATRVQELSVAWANVKGHIPGELLPAINELSSRYSCPAHPGMTGLKGDRCSQCGRSMQPVDQFCGLPSGEPTIKVSVTTATAHSRERNSPVILRLARKDGSPVRESDLLPTHTERIHLFAIDPGLTDYHHVHPRPTNVPGEYIFNFAPAFSSGYRLWLDLLPAASRREELPSVDLGAVGSPVALRQVSDQVVKGNWRLELAFPGGPVRTGFPAWAVLKVTDKSGTACDRLEPFMGNFAHFAAFHEDLRTFYHLHAAGLKEITDPALRAGPDVQVYLPALKAGFVRLFAQVRVDAEIVTAPFGFMVHP